MATSNEVANMKAETFTVDVGSGFPPTVSASFNWTKDIFPEEHEA